MWLFFYGLEICDKDYVKCFYNNKCDFKFLWNIGVYDEGGDLFFFVWINLLLLVKCVVIGWCLSIIWDVEVFLLLYGVNIWLW